MEETLIEDIGPGSSLLCKDSSGHQLPVPRDGDCLLFLIQRGHLSYQKWKQDFR